MTAKTNFIRYRHLFERIMSLAGKLPPPAVFGILALSHLLSGSALGMITPAPWPLISLPVLLAAMFFAFPALLKFTIAGISPLPWKTNRTVLFTTGIYGISRNPMYLSLVLGLAGIGMTFCPVMLLLTVPVLIHFLTNVIRREETVNGIIFRQDFSSYCQKTRRWI